MNCCLCKSNEVRKLEAIDRKNLKDEMLPNGHTVVAVYKKK
jgi:hypothetical protein